MKGPHHHHLSVLLVATFLLTLMILSVSENERSHKPPLKIYGKEIYGKDGTKKILFWTPFFNINDWNFAKLGDDCEVQCTLSLNRSNPLSHDALIFHGRNAQNPPKARTPDQVYIMFLLESPTHRGGFFVKGDHFYNWSLTYSRKSDIYMPYVGISRIANPTASVNITVKSLPQLTHNRTKGEAMIAWVVSQCHTPGKRKQYVNKLQTYMKVDVYGRCGMPCPDKSCHEALAKTGRYKFYLSFENSICKDYITEKVMYPLKVGLVPIVYGGMVAEDYTALLPPRSYIDVRNFTSPKHLSGYLNYLDGNNTAYLEYFKWRRTHQVVELGAQNGWCDLCHALHNKSMGTARNINWDTFWNPKTDCDGRLLLKVLGPNRR